MPLNIIIVGAGLIGPRHAQTVQANAATHLLALIDPSPNAAQTASTLQTAYFPSVAALLASPSTPHPDAAIVCTPNHTHIPIAEELLARGIHVLLEKPISDDPATARALLSKLTPSSPKLLIGHHRRFNPYIAATKQLLSANALGPLIALNGLWTLYKPDTYFAPPGDWRRSTATGGGVLAINLIHDIDLLHYLFGPITRVFGERTRATRPAPPHDAEEGAAVTLRFASGVVGTFLVCDATPAPWSFEAGTGENPLIPRVDGPGGEGFYRIFGERGSLSVPDMRRWSYEGRAQRSWNEELVVERVEVDTGKTPFALQLEHFVDVVGGRAEPVCSGEEGLRALVVVEAIAKALRTGQVVDIET
ncbi:Gfo/Idh/MocA family protein [Aspergillus homomorphus CBS 101889]|uniref:Quinate utilization oxidoreductase QutH n=1 Tax=Aspergillus homomorphus (strain CBS 101889) TaxID=1450537 RepID=A0A395I4J6_ASPHC|nr:quinate utilization oxidoreductase QutH [Aspergillus homomorphus CBS 101889]RAL14108.1 quinate utilization oxidoreductase QutH [Aspergillus homomorphus CBS 101889]